MDNAASKTKKESPALRFLYHTVPGRFLLKGLCAPGLSRAAGAFLSSRLSKPLIKPFVRKNHIDLSQFESDDFTCFNDCFTRKIKPEYRPFSAPAATLTSPCDAYLTVYPIDDAARFSIKHSSYTVDRLLGGNPRAAEFAGGCCLVFRLCVEHYHRYAYFDDCTKGENVFLPGVLHTVRPIALEAVPVFHLNSREYTLMRTAHFGLAAQIEVGAMLVGKIKNLHGAGSHCRGEEKGMFLYGGSTVVLLLQKNRVALKDEILKASDDDCEVPVRMGEAIGTAI